VTIPASYTCSPAETRIAYELKPDARSSGSSGGHWLPSAQNAAGDSI